MTLRFRTLRRVLCAFIALVSCVSIALAFFVLPYFSHREFAWTLVSVEVLSLVRSLWSAFHKQISKRPLSVASETIGLFVLFPFKLIIALIIMTISLRQTEIARVYTALQVFVVLSSVIHLLYTLCLTVIATLTVHAFDRDVWVREIDSAPSPFPMPILFAFVFPCFAHVFASTRSFARSKKVKPARAGFCAPGCTCTNKPHLLGTYNLQPINTQDSMGSLSDRASQRPPGISSPRSLFRIPDAAERRSSIIIALDIR